MLLFLIPGPFTNWARVSLTLPFSLACLLRKRLRELSHGRRDLHRVASPRPPPQPALFTALSFQVRPQFQFVFRCLFSRSQKGDLELWRDCLCSGDRSKVVSVSDASGMEIDFCKVGLFLYRKRVPTRVTGRSWLRKCRTGDLHNLELFVARRGVGIKACVANGAEVSVFASLIYKGSSQSKNNAENVTDT